MSLRQCLPWDEHITSFIPSTRANAFIQDDNGVLHVPVHKMNPEVEEIGVPTWAYLNRTVNSWGITREDQQVLHQEGREKRWRGRRCGTF